VLPREIYDECRRTSRLTHIMASQLESPRKAH
jgi:hypothetical protein